MSWKIHRRTFLTSAGVVLALPMLESLLPKRALATQPLDPRRFVSLYMPNGTYNNHGDAVWYPPTGPLEAATLPLVLAPFASHIADFSIIKHIGCAARDKTAETEPFGGGHLGAVTTWLAQTVMTDFMSTACSVPGSSFDQLVADANKMPLLVLSGGARSESSIDSLPFNYTDYVSFKDGKPNEPHKNPVKLFNMLISDFSPTASVAAIHAAKRNLSILDAAAADIKDLQSKLGRSDNLKLDSYLTSLRNVEKQVNGTAFLPAGNCHVPQPPDPTLDNVDVYGGLSGTYNARVQAFFDLILLAFQCDIVRSVSFMYDGEACGRGNNPCPPELLFENADLSASLHTGISHYLQIEHGREKCISRDRNYLNLMFYLLDRLKSETDVSGTPILDNTLVLAGFNVPDGQHSLASEGIPVVLGGGKNMASPGNCFDFAGIDLTDLFYTFSTKLQMNLTDFRGSTRLVGI